MHYKIILPGATVGGDENELALCTGAGEPGPDRCRGVGERDGSLLLFLAEKIRSNFSILFS